VGKGGRQSRGRTALKRSFLRGEERKIEVRVDPLPGLSAPVAAGQKVGTCVATLDGKVVGTTTVVATQPVEKANWIILFFRWLFAFLGIR
jgi:hypothetical protein